MALPFYSIYPGSSINGRYSYLLASRQTVDPSQPWTGIYLAADQTQPSLGNAVAIDWLFQQFEITPTTA